MNLLLVNGQNLVVPDGIASLDGTITHPLDTDLTARFSLKVTDLSILLIIHRYDQSFWPKDSFPFLYSIQLLKISDGEMFKLAFVVVYRLQGSSSNEEETFYSQDFAVYSNKSNRISKKKLPPTQNET